jgi:hypothetical protein
VNRRLALVLLWLACAVAAVGVGFAAAGLVDDPLTQSVAVQPATDLEPTDDPSTPSASASPSPGGTPTSEQPAASSVTRSLSTLGGLVSATCAQDRVRLAASPALGWEIDDLDAGFRSHPRVRFERSDDGAGRVEVRAECTDSGVPSFELDDRSSDDARFEIEDEDD